MRTRALVSLLLSLAACGNTPRVNFAPAPDAAADAADAADDVPGFDAPSFDVPAADARVDAPSPDAGDARAPVDAARDGTPADVAEDAPVGPDVGACRAMPLGSRLGSLATGSTTGASALEGTCGGADAPEAIFSWTAPRAGTFRFDTGGSDIDTVLYVLDGSCSGPELDCNDDAEKTVQSELRVTLRAGQTVVIAVDGFDEESIGSYSLAVTEEAPADAGPAPDA